ncbi:MAG: O-antigen ligase family protein [Clostridia bacterium]|nr:O-antigen ligase family protein [Clostridia bacterium]
MATSKPRWPGIVTSIIGALWLAAFPLWQDLSYAHITRAKWVAALVLCGVTVLACLVITLILLCKRQWRRAVRLHPVQLVAVLYFGWVALSAWQGQWADSLNAQGQLTVWMGAIRYEGLLTHLCYATIFLMLSFYPPRLNAVLTAAAAAMTAFCGIVALQYAGINVLGLFPTGRSIYTNYEFQGTIGNIDMVSGYVMLVMPMLLGAFVAREKGGWHLLAAGALGAALEWCMDVQSGMIALLLLCGLLVLVMLRFPEHRCRGCVALAAVAAGFALRGMLFLPWLDSATPREVQPVVFTFGKQAALGLIAVAVLLALAAYLHRRPGKAMPVKGILCLTAAAAVLVIAAVALLPVPEGAGGLYELHEILAGRPQDHYGSWRIGVWRHSLAISRDSLVFGHGPDTFYYAMHDHLQTVGATLGENFDNPHNEYVAILVNNGLPALVLYLTLLCWMLAACVRRRQWAMALGLGCYAAQGFFSFSICLVAPMFWAAMGMAAALCGKQLHIEQERAIINAEVK